MWIYIGVFFAMCAADICWTFYLFAVQERKSFLASICAMFIYLFGAFVVTSYIDNKYLIISALLGSFIGTYGTIEYKKWREKK